MSSLDLSVIHVGVLKTSTRSQLAALMDPIKFVSTASGFSRDYQGLAELMDFDNNFIKALESARPSPTKCLLEKWEFRNESTIGKLLDFLYELERFDAIDDLKQKFENDARHFLEKQGCLGQPHSPIQVPEITSSPSSYLDPERLVLTVQDVGIIGQETVQMYDAFVCYTDEDVGFVKELVEKLEKEYNLKLFLEERDLLPGVTELSAICELIQKRCRRMLVVVSPAFLSSKKMEFQMMFAQTLSFEEQKRRVIPVICKPCDVPTRLKLLSCLYFTKADTFGCLWKRLLRSIQPMSPLVQQPMSSSFSSSMNELSVQPSSFPPFQRSSSAERNENTSDCLISEFSSGLYATNAEPSSSASSGNLTIASPDSGISLGNWISAEIVESSETSRASSETGFTRAINRVFKKKKTGNFFKSNKK